MTDPLSKAGGVELPPLPDTDYVIGVEGDGYSEDRLIYGWPAYDDEAMQAYALAAVEADRALRQEPGFVLSDTSDIQMIQNVADPEGAIMEHWPDEFLAWYKPEQWMGPHRAVCVFIGGKIRALRQGALTDEQIIEATKHIDIKPGHFFHVARAIERAHGISAAPAPETKASGTPGPAPSR